MDGQPEHKQIVRRSGSSPPYRGLLLILWICFLLRAAFYSVLFPIWEGFDEYSHFAFIQHVATKASLPLAAQSRVSKEIEESLKLVPLPWLLRELPPPHLVHDDYWKLSESERQRRQDELRAMPAGWARMPASERVLIYEAQQPPLYYWLLAPTLRLSEGLSLPARVLLLRLLSALLASSVVPLAFLAANLVFADRSIALGVAALIAAMPELLVDVCRVGNDSLGVLLYSLFLCFALKFVVNPEQRKISLMLGITLGLGLLTKAYFLAACLALGLIAVCAAFLDRGGRRKTMARGSTALALAALVSAWWYWRNQVLTRTWSGLMQDVDLHQTSLADLLRKVPQVDWRGALDSTFFSHIWFGNWSFLQVRSWMYHSFRLAALFSLLGLVLLIIAPRFKRTARFDILPNRRHLLAITALYASFWLGLCYHVLITFAANGVSSSAGWYLYGVVVAEIILWSAGLFALLPPRLRRWVLPAATAGFGLLDLYTVHFLFIPYYTGLAAHKASGALAAFALTGVSREALWSIPARLLANKPPVLEPLMPFLWAGYFAATVALAAVSLRLAAEMALRSPESHRSGA